MSSSPHDGLRWYTRARRIPRLVGKLPGSERGLPFGPYTITQIVGAAACYLLLGRTTGWWGHFGFLGNQVVQLAGTLAVLLALRLVKPGGRDPLTAAIAAASVWAGPRYGRHRGRAVRPARPHTVTARVRVLIPDCGGMKPVLDEPAAGHAATQQHQPPGPPPAGQLLGVPTGPGLPPAPITNLDRLLACQ